MIIIQLLYGIQNRVIILYVYIKVNNSKCPGIRLIRSVEFSLRNNVLVSMIFKFLIEDV